MKTAQKRWVPVPCGCRIEVSHIRGSMLVTCEGGGKRPTNGSVDRAAMVTCRGGKQYEISAHNVTQYSVRTREAK